MTWRRHNSPHWLVKGNSAAAGLLFDNILSHIRKPLWLSSAYQEVVNQHFFGPSLSTHSAQGWLVHVDFLKALTTWLPQLLCNSCCILGVHKINTFQSHWQTPWCVWKKLRFELNQVFLLLSELCFFFCYDLIWPSASTFPKNTKGSAIYWSRLDTLFSIDFIPPAFPTLRRCTPNALRHFPAAGISVLRGRFMARVLSPDLCIIDILLDHNLSRLKRSHESRLWTCDSV